MCILLEGPVVVFYNTSQKNIEDKFAGVEKIPKKNVFPRLFFGKPKTLSPIVGTICTLLVKKAGLGLLNSVTSAKNKILS